MMNKKTLNNPLFKVEEEEAYRPGVYKIENRDYIYIGSTRVSLAARFLQHFHNDGGFHTKTYNVLHQHGDFTCLESFAYYDPEDVDEQELRDTEAKYIRLFQRNTDKIFLNENLPENYSKKKNYKYHNLKIPDNLYKQIIDEFQRNGYLILNDIMYHKKFDPLDDFDDFAHAYGQFGLIDYMEFGINHNDNHVKAVCKTISLDCNPNIDHIWLNIIVDGTEKSIDIIQNVIGYFAFNYYSIGEILEALKNTMPDMITISKAENTKSRDRLIDDSEWLYDAYKYLRKNNSFINNNSNNTDMVLN